MSEEPLPAPKPRPARKSRAATTESARRLYRDAALKQGRGFTPDRQAEYLAYRGKGVSRSKSAELCGVNYRTVSEYAKRDPAFIDAETAAEVQGVEEIEEVLYGLARDGHMRAIEIVLTNRAPDRWKSIQINKKVTHGGTVTHELEAGASLERIAQLQATLQERAALRELGPPVLDVEVVAED